MQNPTSGAQPHEGQTRTRSKPTRDGITVAAATTDAPMRLRLDVLKQDPAFTPRTGTAKGHVHDLARTLRNGTDLDPITVWPEPGTGRLVILDGRHRAAAYRLCRIESIPARVFNGDRKAARLEAAKENAKTSFPWTATECTQYAWGLVIEGAGSKAQIMQAANVSRTTVKNMRTRLSQLISTGTAPSGNWWRDRNGKPPEGQPEYDTDAAKMDHVAKLREWLNGIETRFKIEFGRRPTMEELGLANRWQLGQARFKAMASGGLIYDEDEFSSDVLQQPLVAPVWDLNDEF